MTARSPGLRRPVDPPFLPGTSIELDPPTIADPVLARVRAYWQRRRGSRAMPRRDDIEPFELKLLLPHLFLIDVLTDDYRYRLLGTALTDRLGRDSTGKSLGELFAADDPVGRWLCAVYDRVVLERRPVLSAAPLLQVDKHYFVGTAIHLPLSSDGVEVDMIFGATRFSEAP